MATGTYYIGIDGGKGGGIVTLNPEGNISHAVEMPLKKTAKGESYDVDAIVTILEQQNYRPTLVILEEAFSVPINSRKSAFTMGELFGTMKTILELKSIPFVIVSAKTWQKHVFRGMMVADTKTAAFEVCNHRFPMTKDLFIEGVRIKRPHTGICDAACIALYGYQTMGGGKE